VLCDSVANIYLKKIKFKLVIAYDGTAYEGWQVQKIGTGVQQIVETALAKLFPSAPRLHSSSRTDTGVHALGMVAHFEIPRAEFKMNIGRLALAINAWLPDDVRVVLASGATEKFHARFDAGGKQYRYFVWNHAAMNPLLRKTAWHVPRKLDLKAMRAAADALRRKEIRRTIHVYHRGRRVSLQNVPGHCGNNCAGRPRQIPAGGNQDDAGKGRPPRGRHDRAGAWAGAVEGFLFATEAQRTRSWKIKSLCAL